MTRTRLSFAICATKQCTFIAWTLLSWVFLLTAGSVATALTVCLAARSWIQSLLKPKGSGMKAFSAFAKTAIIISSKEISVKFAKRPTHKTRMLTSFSAMTAKIGYMQLVMGLTQLNWRTWKKTRSTSAPSAEIRTAKRKRIQAPHQMQFWVPQPQRIAQAEGNEASSLLW